MKVYFFKLFQYNSWANSTVLGFLESRNIKDEQIQKLLSHILNAEYIWLSRITGNSELAKHVWGVHSFGRLTEMSSEVSILYSELITSFSDQDFDRLLQYKNLEGKSFINSIQDIFTHVVNHGSYHRGQINRLIRQKNVDPPITDYIAFIRL